MRDPTKSSTIMMYLVFLILLGIHGGVNALGGIPGTTHTTSGYDTEMGQDAMCWSSIASPTPENGIPFPNGVLVKDFAVADEVKLLVSCPTGTWLTAHAPPEFSLPVPGGFRPRTLEWYNFTVRGRVDVEALNDEFVASDTGSKAAISILACDTVTAGFCSPFVHEQANFRMLRDNVTMKMKVGDRHGGTHVHAPAVLLDLPVNANASYEFEVQVPVLINDPGNFFVVGTLQFFTGDSIFTPISRYDVANALNATERLISYQEPPTILEVSDTVLILSYICIGLVALVLLVLIAATIRHRAHQVMQIAQVDFLIVFLFAALVATIGCVFLDPRSDLWCNLSQTLIMIPLQLFYSITLGRLWRINSVVSPLLRDRLARAASQRGQQQSMFSQFCTKCRSFFVKENSLRRTVSAYKVMWIAAFCTLPQVLMQVLRWVLQPQSKTIEFNADHSIGRSVCDDGKPLGESLDSYSMYLLLLLVIILLIMAHVARKLPSLLNESAVIYDCTLLSITLLILGEGLIAVTNMPTTSPDVPYLIHIALVLSITLIGSYRIIVPKLQMVWSGQEVLVSQLVEDHKQTLRKANMSRNNNMFNVTGLQESSGMPPITGVTTNSPHTSTVPVGGHRPSNLTSSGVHSESLWSGGEVDLVLDESSRIDKETEHSSDHNAEVHMEADGEPQYQGKEATKGVVTFHEGILKSSQPSSKEAAKLAFKNNKSARKIVVREHAVPSKQLVLRMIDLQAELDMINNRIMSGMNVEKGEWESVRRLTSKLELTFDNVEFEWEREEESK